MGNAQSPSGGPRFTSACRAFSPTELEDLKSLFESLAAQSQSNGHFISPTSFQAYFKIHGPLGDRMFDLVTQKRNDQKLTFEDLVIAKGTYEKGTKDEIEEFIYELVDVDGDGTVGRSDMEAVLKAVLDDILSGSSESGSNSNQESIEAFLNGVTFPESGEGSAKIGITFVEFRTWFAHFPSLRKYLGSLLSQPDPGRLGSQVPHLIYFENMESNSLLLKKEYAWHIGGALSQVELDEWKLLYHSSFSGLSFNTFLGNISNDEGPTVFIIKDKEGCIYGGYASQPWERHADFYGDMKSFLFQLYPRASVFKPTGANNNIQWCAVNFTSESIPNGIGFGGRVSHFGLFLSASFDQGHTFDCTTFGSPCLSKTTHIFPDVIECWGIVRKGGGAQQEKNGNGAQSSVLERFKEDRNMLKMVGLANSSE